MSSPGKMQCLFIVLLVGLVAIIGCEEPDEEEVPSPLIGQWLVIMQTLNGDDGIYELDLDNEGNGDGITNDMYLLISKNTIKVYNKKWQTDEFYSYEAPCTISSDRLSIDGAFGEIIQLFSISGDTLWLEGIDVSYGYNQTCIKQDDITLPNL